MTSIGSDPYSKLIELSEQYAKILQVRTGKKGGTVKKDALHDVFLTAVQGKKGASAGESTAYELKVHEFSRWQRFLQILGLKRFNLVRFDQAIKNIIEQSKDAIANEQDPVKLNKIHAFIQACGTILSAHKTFRSSKAERKSKSKIPKVFQRKVSIPEYVLPGTIERVSKGIQGRESRLNELKASEQNLQKLLQQLGEGPSQQGVSDQTIAGYDQKIGAMSKRVEELLSEKDATVRAEHEALQKALCTLEPARASIPYGELSGTPQQKFDAIEANEKRNAEAMQTLVGHAKRVNEEIEGLKEFCLTSRGLPQKALESIEKNEGETHQGWAERIADARRSVLEWKRDIEKDLTKRLDELKQKASALKQLNIEPVPEILGKVNADEGGWAQLTALQGKFEEAGKAYETRRKEILSRTQERLAAVRTRLAGLQEEGLNSSIRSIETLSGSITAEVSEEQAKKLTTLQSDIEKLEGVVTKKVEEGKATLDRFKTVDRTWFEKHEVEELVKVLDDGEARTQLANMEKALDDIQKQLAVLAVARDFYPAQQIQTAQEGQRKLSGLKEEFGRLSQSLRVKATAVVEQRRIELSTRHEEVQRARAQLGATTPQLPKIEESWTQQFQALKKNEDSVERYREEVLKTHTKVNEDAQKLNGLCQKCTWLPKYQLEPLVAKTDKETLDIWARKVAARQKQVGEWKQKVQEACLTRFTQLQSLSAVLKEYNPAFDSSLPDKIDQSHEWWVEKIGEWSSAIDGFVQQYEKSKSGLVETNKAVFGRDCQAVDIASCEMDSTNALAQQIVTLRLQIQASLEQMKGTISHAQVKALKELPGLIERFTSLTSSRITTGKEELQRLKKPDEEWFKGPELLFLATQLGENISEKLETMRSGLQEIRTKREQIKIEDRYPKEALKEAYELNAQELKLRQDYEGLTKSMQERIFVKKRELHGLLAGLLVESSRIGLPAQTLSDDWPQDIPAGQREMQSLNLQIEQRKKEIEEATTKIRAVAENYKQGFLPLQAFYGTKSIQEEVYRQLQNLVDEVQGGKKLDVFQTTLTRIQSEYSKPWIDDKIREFESRFSALTEDQKRVLMALESLKSDLNRLKEVPTAKGMSLEIDGLIARVQTDTELVRYLKLTQSEDEAPVRRSLEQFSTALQSHQAEVGRIKNRIEEEIRKRFTGAQQRIQEAQKSRVDVPERLKPLLSDLPPGKELECSQQVEQALLDLPRYEDSAKRRVQATQIRREFEQRVTDISRRVQNTPIKSDVEALRRRLESLEESLRTKEEATVRKEIDAEFARIDRACQQFEQVVQAKSIVTELEAQENRGTEIQQELRRAVLQRVPTDLRGQSHLPRTVPDDLLKILVAANDWIAGQSINTESLRAKFEALQREIRDIPKENVIWETVNTISSTLGKEVAPSSNSTWDDILRMVGEKRGGVQTLLQRAEGEKTIFLASMQQEREAAIVREAGAVLEASNEIGRALSRVNELLSSCSGDVSTANSPSITGYRDRLGQLQARLAELQRTPVEGGLQTIKEEKGRLEKGVAALEALITQQQSREQTELDANLAGLISEGMTAGVQIPEALQQSGLWDAERRRVYNASLESVQGRQKSLSLLRQLVETLERQVSGSQDVWIQKTKNELLAAIQNLQSDLQKPIQSDQAFHNLEGRLADYQRQASELTSRADANRAEALHIETVKRDYLGYLEAYEKATNDLKAIYEKEGFPLTELEPLLRQCSELRSLFDQCNPKDEESLLREKDVFASIKRSGDALRGVYEQLRATFVQHCLQKGAEKRDILNAIQQAGVAEVSGPHGQLEQVPFPPASSAIGSEISWATQLFEKFPAIDTFIQQAQQQLVLEVQKIGQAYSALGARAAVMGRQVAVPDLPQVTFATLPQVRDHLATVTKEISDAETKGVAEVTAHIEELESIIRPLGSWGDQLLDQLQGRGSYETLQGMKEPEKLQALLEAKQALERIFTPERKEVCQALGNWLSSYPLAQVANPTLVARAGQSLLRQDIQAVQQLVEESKAIESSVKHTASRLSELMPQAGLQSVFDGFVDRSELATRVAIVQQQLSAYLQGQLVEARQQIVGVNPSDQFSQSVIQILLERLNGFARQDVRSIEAAERIVATIRELVGVRDRVLMAHTRLTQDVRALRSMVPKDGIETFLSRHDLVDIAAYESKDSVTAEELDSFDGLCQQKLTLLHTTRLRLEGWTSYGSLERRAKECSITVPEINWEQTTGEAQRAWVEEAKTAIAQQEQHIASELGQFVAELDRVIQSAGASGQTVLVNAGILQQIELLRQQSKATPSQIDVDRVERAKKELNAFFSDETKEVFKHIGEWERGYFVAKTDPELLQESLDYLTPLPERKLWLQRWNSLLSSSQKAESAWKQEVEGLYQLFTHYFKAVPEELRAGLQEITSTRQAEEQGKLVRNYEVLFVKSILNQLFAREPESSKPIFDEIHGLLDGFSQKPSLEDATKLIRYAQDRLAWKNHLVHQAKGLKSAISRVLGQLELYEANESIRAQLKTRRDALNPSVESIEQLQQLERTIAEVKEHLPLFEGYVKEAMATGRRKRPLEGPAEEASPFKRQEETPKSEEPPQ